MGQKSWYRVVLAFFLVLAVGVSLWFAAPVEDSAEAYNNQGLVYNNEGEYDKAVDAFSKAIELDPELALAYGNRGWAYIKLGQHERGIADLDKAIELDPNFLSPMKD